MAERSRAGHPGGAVRWRRHGSSVAAVLVLVASVFALVLPTPGQAAEPIGTITIMASGMLDPLEITPGPDGNLWFTNQGKNSIGRITPTGVVTDYTGVGISSPSGIAAGPDGNLWFANLWGESIGRITPAGVVTNYTGIGIDYPTEIVTGPDGNLWFTNKGNDSIGRVTPAGVVTNYSGTGIDWPNAIAAGPDGNLWFTNYRGDSIGRITPAGVVTIYAAPGIDGPSEIVAGPDGNLWFTSYVGDAIGRITPGGVVTEYTGTGISEPSGIGAGPDGNLWFTNHLLNSIGRITPDGVVTNYTGTGISGPHAITAGPDGNLWFTNHLNDSIGRITLGGVVTNFIGTGVSEPLGIGAGPDGNLWFTNRLTNSIGRITPDGAVTNFTGTGISDPHAITAGPDGNLWFTNNDSANSSIGRITPAGSVTTFTGTGIVGPRAITAGPDGNLWFTNDGGPSPIGRITPAGVVTSYTGPGISRPVGITAGPDGNLWFTNHLNDSIGRITPGGVVTNFTGFGIDAPYGIVAGPDGNLWFTNYGGNSIGRITPGGVVANYTGSWVSWPKGIAAGPDGNLWFTNYLDDSIGRITPSGAVTNYPGTGIHIPDGIAAGPDGNLWFTAARNIIGRVTATAAPGTPLGVTALPGARSATVSWSAPLEDGGSVISGYTVTASPGGATCSWSSGPLSCVVGGLTAGASYSFTVSATNGVGTGPPSAVSNTVSPWDGSGYHPLSPSRVLDSRTTTGGWGASLSAGAARDLQVAGLGGASSVPASASAVVLNVTATGATAGSFLSVFAAGSSPPTASNVNFAPGQTIPNLVTVKLGAGGKVAFANAIGSVDVVADVVGYYDDGSGPGDLFTGVTPTRLLDSRTAAGGWSGQLAAGAPRDLVVRQPANAAGVPPTATAVIANVTVTGGTAGSFVSVWPSGETQPGVSNLNLAPGQTIANLVIVKIGSNGAISFANAVGGVDVIVDVVGYFDPTAGSRFHVIDPTRILDDRVPTGLPGPWGPGQTRALPVAGAPATTVPADATGLVTNVTVTAGTAGSYVTVFPDGVPLPTASNVNFGPGETIANLVTVGIAPNANIALANHLGNVDLIADAVGYYTPS